MHWDAVRLKNGKTVIFDKTSKSGATHLPQVNSTQSNYSWRRYGILLEGKEPKTSRMSIQG